MYVHDIDTGTFDGAHAGGESAARNAASAGPTTRWPPTAARRPRMGLVPPFAQAVNAVESKDGAMSPPATARSSSSAPSTPAATSRTRYGRRNAGTRDGQPPHGRICERSVRHPRAVHLGRAKGPRVPMLRERLDAVGHGHGIFVVPFVGGDNYFSDQPVSTGPALHRLLSRRDSVYTRRWAPSPSRRNCSARSTAGTPRPPARTRLSGIAARPSPS